MSSLLNSYFSKISKTIQETTDNVKKINAQDLTAKIKQRALETHSNLIKEKNNFINIMKDEKSTGNEAKNYEFPWETVNESNCNNVEETVTIIKEKIIRLSEYQSNFLNGPPKDSGWNFDYDDNAKMAMNLMKIDGRLNKLRFKLVPSKLKEIDFWGNYFYHISVIVESYTMVVNNGMDVHKNSNSDSNNTRSDEGDNSTKSGGSNALKSGKAYEDALDAALDNDDRLNLLDDLDDDDDDIIDFVSNDVNNVSLANDPTLSKIDASESKEDSVERDEQVIVDKKFISSNEDFDDDLDWQKELDAELDAELSD